MVLPNISHFVCNFIVHKRQKNIKIEMDFSRLRRQIWCFVQVNTITKLKEISKSRCWAIISFSLRFWHGRKIFTWAWCRFSRQTIRFKSHYSMKLGTNRQWYSADLAYPWIWFHAFMCGIGLHFLIRKSSLCSDNSKTYLWNIMVQLLCCIC